jgi:hypothetical protein
MYDDRTINVLNQNRFNSEKIQRLIAVGGGTPPVNLDFVSTWDTTKAGSASDTIVLPMTAGPTVDWGDGTVNTSNTHTYAVAGIKTITISGTINTFRFAFSGDKAKILDVSNWGGFEFSNSQIFQGCTSFDITATDIPIVSTTSAFGMFLNCNLTNVDFSQWDWSTCTNFYFFFLTQPNFTGNIEGIINSGVTNIRQAFTSTPLGNQDLSTWDVSGITNWVDALRNCQLGALTDVSGWVPKGNMNGVFLTNPDFEGLGLDTWTIGGITSAGNTFISTNISTVNYDLLLVSWEAQAPPNAVAINFGSANYTIGSAAEAARASLISTYGWTITDGGGI